MICGERNPALLTKRRASLIEGHHIAGRANDPNLVVYLCRNHHELQTLRQTGIGVELKDDPQRSLLERLVSLLRGLALLCDDLARSLVGWANQLVDFIEALDADLPGWRKLCPA